MKDEKKQTKETKRANNSTKSSVKNSGTSTKKDGAKKTSSKPSNKKVNSNVNEKTKSTVKKVKEVKEEFVNEEVKEKNTSEEKTKKVTKKRSNKSDAFLVLGLVVVIIFGCLLMWGNKEKPSYELPLTLTGEAGLHQLTYAEYQEKIDNNESFVVIIERTTCSHCASFMPVAETFASDNNVPMYYVDTDTFSEEDWNTFETSNTFFKKNTQWGTPTTLVLVGKEAIDSIIGETDASALSNLYNKYFDMSE